MDYFSKLFVPPKIWQIFLILWTQTAPNTIKLIVMNYGMTWKMKILRELAYLKENNHRLRLTFDEWSSSMNKRYMNANVHTFLIDNVVFLNLKLICVFGSMPDESILKTKLTEFGLVLEKDININYRWGKCNEKVGSIDVTFTLALLCSWSSTWHNRYYL